MGQGVIVVRPFLVSDIAAVLPLEQTHQPRPWTEGIFKDELAASDRVYLVADDDGVVGFGGVMTGPEAHVTNLMVVPDRRGEGIGRRLLVDLIRAAVDSGSSHLTLEVRSRNQAARALYASVGLAPVGVRRGYYGDDDALIMWAHDIDHPGYLQGLR
jgi:ribosomal-protein-alanine N-acetyltransferase